VQIINACCVLHNFLVEKRLESDARLLDEVDADLLNEDSETEIYAYEDEVTPIQGTNEWTNFRENLAITMFNEYQARRGLI